MPHLSVLFATALAALTSADAIVAVLNTPSASGVRRFAEAKALVERDAREGKPLQQYVVALTGDDVDLRRKYLAAAKPKIRLLAETRNNPLAWYLLSVETNDRTMLERAAAGGNVQALNALGTLITAEAANDRSGKMSTNDVVRALEKAFDCYHKAALQKDPNGLVNLGACFLGGIGCSVDRKLAFNCFLAAAKLGHPEAMDNVSAAYELGHGTEIDMSLSTFWKLKGRAARGDKASEDWLRSKHANATDR